ncbi:DUF4136 domain-containing protein [Sandaracinobacter neustonicus]|nr:DUF4136 domain-containing protein [Sandaracinobacter neustonicus]
MRMAPAHLGSALVIAAALALGACSTTPSANVLRFHQNQPVSRGTVYLKPANPALAGSLEFQAQANAVGAELRKQGFEPVSSPQVAQFTAVIDVQTTERVGPPRQSGVSIGIGGGFSSGNVGVGTSVQVPVGGQPSPQVATTTTLSVSLVQALGNQAVWEGRSSLDTQPGGQRGTPLTPVLASALFQDFPGPSGKTVQVPIR